MTCFKRLMALTVTLALATPGGAAPSPTLSPTAARLVLEQREAAIWPTETRIRSGAGGVVTGTASPIAVHAGAEALRQGGTAADAVVATALTQVTTMLGANVSFAGVAELLYFEAKTGKVHALDAGWNSWRGETSSATIPDTDLSGITNVAGANAGAAGRKTLVPGFMAGMEATHRGFGRLPFRRLFAPSLWYARNGVPVTGLLGAYFAAAEKHLMLTRQGRRFAMPGGAHLPKIGDRFVQPELAAFLEAVAGHGAAHMYRGPWAQHYVDAVRDAGGVATMADMAAYRPRWTVPLTTTFRDATIFGPAAPNSSGCAILAALNLLDHGGPTSPYWQDAMAFRRTALAMRLAMAAPYAPELTAFEQRAGIGGNCAARLTPGWGATVAPAMEAMLGGATATPAGHHSASVVAIDRWGNVAVLVHSSNTPMWGDTGMIVDGVPIPVPAGLYRHELMKIAPGDRVPTDMAPILVLREGKPVLGVATIGSSLMQETVRLVAGLLPGGDAALVMGAPPLLLNFEQFEIPMMDRDELVPAGRYPPQLLQTIRAAGLKVREVDAQRALILKGTAVAGMIDAGKAPRSIEVPGVMSFAEAE
jgi:gamma-glutamyltranspeptidase/glutathione hydrolase